MRLGVPRRLQTRVVTGAVGPQQAARVYIYKSPLMGWERIAEAAGPVADSLALHAGIVCSDADSVVLHDFVPADPTSPATAAILLAGGSVPGCCV